MNWKTKEGKIMNIKDMDNSHLLNSIAYLKRRVPRYYGSLVATAIHMGEHTSGDMACDIADRAIEDVASIDENDILKDWGYFGLLKEAKKRNLIHLTHKEI